MNKGITMMLIVCFGIFVLMLALGVAIPDMNLTNFGLDFTTMDPGNVSLWVMGFWIIGFGVLAWGVTNE